MSRIRLLELYTSVQGEGPNTGRPTTFVRFAGCNMRCPGWPCDTPYAIFPEQWTKEAQRLAAPDVFNLILAESPKHVCITGGEPLLQPRQEMETLLDLLFHSKYTVDIFTNGSRDLAPYQHSGGTTFIMDWKLPGSGEAESFVEQRNANLPRLRPWDAVKLVIVDQIDLRHAERYIEDWHATQSSFKVYVGAAWGEMREQDLVHWLVWKGYHWVNLNVQVHKLIFPDRDRGI